MFGETSFHNVILACNIKYEVNNLPKWKTKQCLTGFVILSLHCFQTCIETITTPVQPRINDPNLGAAHLYHGMCIHA